MALINHFAGLGGIFLICLFVITPMYISFIRRNYRELWKDDLYECESLPYLRMNYVFMYVIKNKFKKTHNKGFIFLSYIYKYAFIISTITAMLIITTPILSYLEQFEFMTRPLN
jgi:hypothetical protein